MKDQYSEKPIILFYPTGTVHLNNLMILERILPYIDFRVVMEQHWEYMYPEALRKLPNTKYLFKKSVIPDDIWIKKPKALFFSMAYPNLIRCNLLYEAAIRGIPAISIEEVNQLALNNGVINHYFLPLDMLGVASPGEAQMFTEVGYTSDQLNVTGWPFYSGNYQSETHTAKGLRKKLGINSDAQVALLTLSTLKENDPVSQETLHTRKILLNTVQHGLPEEMVLLIKPHPADDHAAVLLHAGEYAPGAYVIDGSIGIDEALDAADFCINRGNSQVVIEAMIRDIPIGIVSAGIKTIFDDMLPEVVAGNPDELKYIISRFKDSPPIYTDILKVHAPYDQEASHRATADFISQAINTKPVTPVYAKVIDVVLQLALLGNTGEALMKLEKARSNYAFPQEIILSLDMIDRLIRMKAAINDIEILFEVFPQKMRRWHVQALYARQLYAHKKNNKLIKNGLQLLNGFDGQVNPHYFVKELSQRTYLEVLYGNGPWAEKMRSWLIENYSFNNNVIMLELLIRYDMKQIDYETFKFFFKYFFNRYKELQRKTIKLNGFIMNLAAYIYKIKLHRIWSV